MARDVQAANDHIDYGSDASIDDLSNWSVMIYRVIDSGGTHALVTKGQDNILAIGVTSGWIFVNTDSATSDGHIRFGQNRNTTDGVWMSADDSATRSDELSVGFAYDDSDTGNNPTLFVDGASVAAMESNTPLGGVTSDGALSLRTGEDSGGQRDADGRIGWLVIYSGLLTAADANRHKWWGRAPGGPSTMEVWHPMWTDSLANKGTATADGTVSGSVPMATGNNRLSKVMRPGCGGGF